MPMKAGYWYAIKVEMEKIGGHTYSGRILAYEKNAQGLVTQTFDPRGRRH
jgi:hypothetical protein